MQRILCDRSHSGQILEIFNEAILSSTALWDYERRTPAMMAAWFDAKERGKFPVVGFLDEQDELLAFGSYGTFRAWPAYKYTVEHSLYVERSARGRGLGTRMLQELIAAAREQGYHNLVGGIATENEASIKTHLKCGFQPCGTLRECGFKFGRWIDLSFYQRVLDTPREPVDG